jgi:acyl carrier protein
MTDFEDRIRRCFGSVFTDAEPDQLERLSQSNCAQWDSVGHVTLIAALGEEFGTDLDFDAFSEATSYDAVTKALRSQLQPS